MRLLIIRDVDNSEIVGYLAVPQGVTLESVRSMLPDDNDLLVEEWDGHFIAVPDTKQTAALVAAALRTFDRPTETP